jgi:hypothetical protein
MFLVARRETTAVYAMVVELKEHLWEELDGQFKPFNYNPYASKHLPAKCLPPLYMQDGGIFFSHINKCLQTTIFNELLDINETRDYLLAKAILKNNNNN